MHNNGLLMLLGMPFSSEPPKTRLIAQIHPDIIHALRLISDVPGYTFSRLVEELLKAGILARAAEDSSFRSALKEADDIMHQEVEADDAFMEELGEGGHHRGKMLTHEEVVRQLKREELL